VGRKPTTEGQTLIPSCTNRRHLTLLTVTNILPELKPVRPLNPPQSSSTNPRPYVSATSYIPFHSTYSSSPSAQYQPPQQMAYGHTQSTFPTPQPVPSQWMDYSPSPYSNPPIHPAPQYSYYRQSAYTSDLYGRTHVPMNPPYDPHSLHSPMTQLYNAGSHSHPASHPPVSSHSSAPSYASTWNNPPPAPARSVPSQHHTLSASHFGSHS